MGKNRLRRLPIERAAGSGRLKRSIGTFELFMLGVGATIGSGIFVVTGVAAAEHAGPGLILSFLIAGVACCCAALCYAELASSIPASGGAYTFAYTALGEAFAWFIGWCLTLEYVVTLAAVSVGWSAYITNILSVWGIYLPRALTASPFSGESGGLINLPAMVIIAAMTLLQLKGSRESAHLNDLCVFLKVGVIFLFIFLSAGKVDIRNYTPFLPFGWSGVWSGAAVVFFAYLGFDAICNSAEEVKDPQKTMPRGILGSLAVATVLYIAVTLVLTGVLPYFQYKGIAAPVAFALNEIGIRWGSALISAGALAGLTTGVLIFVGAESRLVYSIARDGLLPKRLSHISGSGIPDHAVVVVWAVGSIFAGILPIEMITGLCNIGTLSAFFMVSFIVLIMRKTHPKLHRGFYTPAVPVIPLISMILCSALAMQLSKQTWNAFFIWSSIGIFIYLLYGRAHSDLGKRINGSGK